MMMKTTKKIIATILAVIIVTATPICAYADGDTGVVESRVETVRAITVPAIAEELFAGESDPTIRRICVDAMIASVDPNAQIINNRTVIGTYEKNPAMLNTAKGVSGPYNFAYSNNNDVTTATIYYAKAIDSTTRQSNYEDIIFLYNAANDLKTEVSGMDERAKSLYILDYIADRCEYIMDFDYAGGAVMLRSGKGLCASYASLYYILATYTGLNTTCVSGVEKKSGICHVWNNVLVDGEWLAIDASGYDVNGGSMRWVLVPCDTMCQFYDVPDGDFDDMLNVLMVHN